MKLVPVFFLLAILSGCASNKPTITSYTSPGIDFTQYQRYAFLRTTDTAFTKQGINRSQLAHAFTSEAVKQINQKGLHADTVNPDCFFRYQLKIKTSYEVDNYANIAYSGQTYGEPFELENIYVFGSKNKPAVYGQTINIDTLKEGSLVIEMIDAKTDSTVWYSKAEAKREISEIAPMKEVIHQVVPKMFKRFPK